MQSYRCGEFPRAGRRFRWKNGGDSSFPYDSAELTSPSRWGTSGARAVQLGIRTLVIATYFVTLSRMQLPWVTLSAKGQGASPRRVLYKKDLSRKTKTPQRGCCCYCCCRCCLGQQLRHQQPSAGQAVSSMPFGLRCHFALIFLAALEGESRYLEARDAGETDPFLLLDAELKRELSDGQIFRRSLRCLDMLAIEGQFTYTAGQPQMHCATFFIGEPEEFITIDFDFINIDCQAGDILKVFDGWILKGEKFPSSLDHPLPTSERYINFCDGDDHIRSTIRSSQNVAMIFFRIHNPGNGFTLTIKKKTNIFPCNVISQTPAGRFTLVIPHQHRNCSFSIIYPVEIKISDLMLGHLNDLQLKKPSMGCEGMGDFVELLGGNGLDPSRMLPLADLCHSFHGPAQMKVGCDNTVLRMVSSGKHINRVTFEYHQLKQHELENREENSLEEFCFSSS